MWTSGRIVVIVVMGWESGASQAYILRRGQQDLTQNCGSLPQCLNWRILVCDRVQDSSPWSRDYSRSKSNVCVIAPCHILPLSRQYTGWGKIIFQIVHCSYNPTLCPALTHHWHPDADTVMELEPSWGYWPRINSFKHVLSQQNRLMLSSERLCFDTSQSACKLDA